MNVGSLFSGIGGFDLGLERAGMQTLWLCEQDPYCQRVLAKHWPGVPIHADVRALVADTSGAGRRQDLRGAYGNETANEGRPAPHADVADGGGQGAANGPMVPVPVPRVDVLAGGFPCQDLSYAGRGAGIDGARSGLWGEYARLIRELRPRYVVVENVSALLARGMGRVLADLAACGYDAEWDCIPASAVGAPHRRDRVWLVAYPSEQGLEGQRTGAGLTEVPEPRDRGALADAKEQPIGAGLCADESRGKRRGGPSDGGGPGVMADAEGKRQQPRSWPSDAMGTGQLAAVQSQGCVALPADGGWGADHWLAEPDVGRVAHGVPARVDRLRALGNALVPQIAEWIGRRIIEAEQRSEGVGQWVLSH